MKQIAHYKYNPTASAVNDAEVRKKKTSKKEAVKIFPLESKVWAVIEGIKDISVRIKCKHCGVRKWKYEVTPTFTATLGKIRRIDIRAVDEEHPETISYTIDFPHESGLRFINKSWVFDRKFSAVALANKLTKEKTI